MTRLPGRTPWGGSRWYVATTGSTMDDARQLEASGEPVGTVVRAGHQRAGVGRHTGRRWTSEPEESLLFTGYWSDREFARPTFAPSLTLALGVCLWLEQRLVGGPPVALKWPNDVYLGGAKLAGILVRAVRSAAATRYHAGVGLNVAQRRFEGEFRTPPTSLWQAGLVVTPEQVLDELLPSLASAMALEDPRSACEARLWRRGQSLELTLPGEPQGRQGTVLGLGPEGQLRWATRAGEELVSAGE